VHHCEGPHTQVVIEGVSPIVLVSVQSVVVVLNSGDYGEDRFPGQRYDCFAVKLLMIVLHLYSPVVAFCSDTCALIQSLSLVLLRMCWMRLINDPWSLLFPCPSQGGGT